MWHQRPTNWPKMVSSQIRYSYVFSVRKPMLVLELYNSIIIISFVTSLTSKMAQNYPKIIKNTIKLVQMMVFFSNIVFVCVLGKKIMVSRFQNFKILTSCDVTNPQNGPKIWNYTNLSLFVLKKSQNFIISTFSRGAQFFRILVLVKM